MSSLNDFFGSEDDELPGFEASNAAAGQRETAAQVLPVLADLGHLGAGRESAAHGA